MIFSTDYFGEHLDTDIEHYFVIGHLMYLVPFNEALINNQNRLLAVLVPIIVIICDNYSNTAHKNFGTNHYLYKEYSGGTSQKDDGNSIYLKFIVYSKVFTVQ